LTLHNITAADASRLLDDLTTIVSRAAGVVLKVKDEGLKARNKPDMSPVTAADEAAEAVIIEAVSRLLPGLAVVSEEAAGRAPPAHLGGCFVLVDPVDGTRELLAGRDEYTVNVALIDGGRPILGVISAPARGLLWRAAAGLGAERMALPPGAPASAARERTAIRPRPLPRGALLAAVSRSHFDAQTRAFLARLGPMEPVASGSSVKFCWVAEGTVDVYPRLAPTREWDIAAGHAIVTAAGGTMTAPDGQPLCYGRTTESFLVPGFIAWGDPAAAARLKAPA
jgi:3'(2'), 5'-bisphosphate nucleotidase